MSGILALDLSKRSTGWAIWPEGADRAWHGFWQLGSEYSKPGQPECKLHQEMQALYAVHRFDWVFFEDPIHPAQLNGATNIDTIRILAGLAAHAESFAFAMGCRPARRVNVASWRADFIGRGEINRIQKETRERAKREGKKISARDQLKDMTVERCRQLGFTVRRNDEADALGILDFACGLIDVIPPWRAQETLRPMLTGAK